MTRQFLRRFWILAALMLLFPSPDSFAAGPEKTPRATTRAVTGNDFFAPFLINNVYSFYANNGSGSYNPFTSDNEGFEFYKGNGKHLIFEDGVVWGGYHKGFPDPKAGGSGYRYGLQAGPIVTYGTPTTVPVAADPVNPAYRLYRVRPDLNPNTVSQADGEAKLAADEVPFITRDEPSATATSLWNDYVKDWNEWPAALGAPFTDVNGDGIYDPAVDMPGMPGADQTLWYVANDLDTVRVSRFTGCPPIGLEVHRTIWGYRRGGALGNTIFISTLLINKSGAPVDSMFLSQWADVDIGDAGDDLVGCDTLRNLGYGYNGFNIDKIYGAAIPAPGFALLAGPAVPSAGDTAIFHRRYRPGYRNLPMTSFVMFTEGNVNYTDPRQGPGGNIDWWRMMHGLTRDGLPFHDPLKGEDVRFAYPGDPVKATDGSAGWVDGTAGGGLAPMDRRLCLSTGPFTLAAGDTQEIVIATAAGLGADRLSSITALRSVVDEVRGVFKTLFTSIPPGAAAKVSFPTPTLASLRLIVDGRPTRLQKVSGSLRTDSLSGPSFDFYDDGTHGDSLAGDKLFTAVHTVPTALKPVSLDLTVIDGTGTTRSWQSVAEHISIAGPLAFTGLLFSDNINSDGQVNPGENIRYGVATTNQTQFTLSNLEIRSGNPPVGVGYVIASLAPGAADAMPYRGYFSVDVPSSYSDSLLRIPVSLKDASGNQWDGMISFRVVPFSFTPKSTLVNAVGGSGKGAFEIRIVNPSALKNHQYAIEGVTAIDASGTPGFTLRDLADNRVLLENHPLPDELGHDIPATDGFKVLRGTIDVVFGYSSYAVGANGQRDITWVGADPTGSFASYLEGFGNAIGTGSSYPFIATSVTPDRLRSVMLKFAAADGKWDPRSVQSDVNFSRGYRYLRNASNPTPAPPDVAPWIVNKGTGYPFQEYSYSVPFAAYDIDATPPRRLAVGHLENWVVGGLVDGRYWPQKQTDIGVDNTAINGPREWFFIYDLPYPDAPDPVLGSVTSTMSSSGTVPLMWWGIVTRRAVSPNDSGYFRAGTELTILAKHPPSTGQTWTFNPELLLSVPEAPMPTAFALEQNYPNPFNPATTIRFQLPTMSRVRLTIYDLLGRQLICLVNGPANAGIHEVRWDARTVASGVYFYRLEATPQDSRGGKRVETRKMIMLR